MKSLGLFVLLLSVFVITSKADNKWYDEVSGYSIWDSDNGYAGVYGVPVTALKVNSGCKYRVHLLNGNWLPEVNGFSETNHDNGYAGTKRGDTIDAIAVSCGVEYAVHTVGGGWLPAVSGYDIWNDDYGYAGIYGKAIDAVMIKNRKYATAHYVEGNGNGGNGNGGNGNGGNGNGGNGNGGKPVSCSVKDDMSLFATNLTRQQFINDLKNSASYYDYLYLLSNNAGTVYDEAIKNGINPELVVARAISEGFAPGVYNSNNYNYYGLNCYNGVESSTCASYNSLGAGIKAFADNIKYYGYKTPGDMMQKYVYIGDYWFKPGDWGSGGCPYFDSIKPYLSASRRNVVANQCNYGGNCYNGGYGDCLKTTPEDQSAYAKWASLKMVNIRNDIFC